MFYNCTSLVTAPELPATTLATSCYRYMFDGCTNLTKAPKLPATTLTDYCYYSMFYGCTSLVTAPELPATTLAKYCYTSMFYNCRKLNYIKALFTTIPSTTYTDNWVSGVSSTGTFVKNKNATWNVTGNNGVPTGWTVVNDAEENVNLITFYVDNIEYQAEEGMTWKEWINSEYNNNSFINVSNYVYTYNTGNAIWYSNIGNDVPVSDIIIENHVYYKSPYGGAG